MLTVTEQALWVTIVVTAGYQLIFFIIASANRFDKVTDLAGGSNFVLLALLTLGMYAIPNPSPRQIVNTSLVVIWGCRLSVFLFYRILMFKSDNRFDSLRDKPLNFFGFWILQMVWVWIVSLPIIYLNAHETGQPSLKPADYAGFAMAATGYLIEAWADQVKLAVKTQPSRVDNHHVWCESGPWYYSRHPNYFGELLFWWGIFTSVSQTLIINGSSNRGYFVLAGPVLISVLLLFISGIPILEKSANIKYGNDFEYIAYREETSILIPMPRTLYRKIPKIIKQIFLFEWPMYETDLANGDLSSTSNASTAV